ncbi:hypothetical protein AG1IA_03342 [Rhizoctonia solani AG-1 IA]|uniref:Uncharacterized protein n=1 Tax=Thanatephorus cucumeris (strain AG1-IA) TaxID=983506 RepID=L8X0Q9_THACA|nr:hypothetical protein AG1IA_03342 [Rhizoctonia solani AG-1 IA]
MAVNQSHDAGMGRFTIKRSVSDDALYKRFDVQPSGPQPPHSRDPLSIYVVDNIVTCLPRVRYIFTFKEGTGENSPQAIKAKEFIKSQALLAGGKITHDYGEIGFAAEVPEQGYANIASFTDNDLADAVEAVGW